MEPAHDYPWRQLGALLVDEGLLTDGELEQALAEQARSGRLLGQILVSNGYLSAFSLARVLSEQHGVLLQSRASHVSLADPPELGEAAAQSDAPWQPLGKLLIDRGFLRPLQLEEALQAQRSGHGRLGEILVTRGMLTARQLAEALSEQQGVELDAARELELTATIKPASATEPTYKVYELTFEPGFQRRTELYESPNFLEAADYAFELVEQHEPEALEIHRTHGAAQETVWSYSASRAAAAQAVRRDLVETFGFDPVRWGMDR
jgi:hypothetical protein